MNREYTKDEIVKGIVSGITDYGIFIKIDDKYSGLIHISAISDKYVKDIKNYASIDETINVKIIDIDKNSAKMKLSIKDIPYKIYPEDHIIKETKHGFTTLKANLPKWIDENLKSVKNK